MQRVVLLAVVPRLLCTFFSKPSITHDEPVVTTVIPGLPVSPPSTPPPVSITPVTQQAAVEYKPFTPLPEVQTSSGDYLNALSGSASSRTSGAISGSSSGQSGYLDALQSQNTKPASGMGLRGYLDTVVASKTTPASTPTPVVAEVQPEPVLPPVVKVATQPVPVVKTEVEYKPYVPLPL